MKHARHCALRFVRQAVRWLAFLGRLQPPAVPPCRYADHLARFTDYMVRDRGLSPRTVDTVTRMIRAFLVRLDTAGLGLAELTVPQADELLIQMVRDGRYARTSIQTCASALRGFFRYAEACGWCRPGLAAAIRAPRVFPHATLPVGPSWEDVHRLLATTHGDRAVEVRDRALLMLLAVYGLRASEVVGLRLEDFDWKHLSTAPRLRWRAAIRRRPLPTPAARPAS
jgi:site-specific recombinase XerD